MEDITNNLMTRFTRAMARQEKMAAKETPPPTYPSWGNAAMDCYLGGMVQLSLPLHSIWGLMNLRHHSPSSPVTRSVNNIVEKHCVYLLFTGHAQTIWTLIPICSGQNKDRRCFCSLFFQTHLWGLMFPKRGAERRGVFVVARSVGSASADDYSLWLPACVRDVLLH